MSVLVFTGILNTEILNTEILNTEILNTEILNTGTTPTTTILPAERNATSLAGSFASLTRELFSTGRREVCGPGLPQQDGFGDG